MWYGRLFLTVEGGTSSHHVQHPGGTRSTNVRRSAMAREHALLFYSRAFLLFIGFALVSSASSAGGVASATAKNSNNVSTSASSGKDVGGIAQAMASIETLYNATGSSSSTAYSVAIALELTRDHSSDDSSATGQIGVVPDELIMQDDTASSGSLALPEAMHGVPSNPTLVTAAASDGTADVTWKAPDDDGGDPVTEYEVAWFDEEQNTPAGTQTVPAAALGSNEVLVAHLENGRSYTFKVRAKNKNGFSVWSAKSPAVSPLHPPDLCGRLSCSGRGACFPNYHAADSAWLDVGDRRVLQVRDGVSGTAIDDDSLLNAFCICRPGYAPPDCSVKSDEQSARYAWKTTEWSDCSSGCGGGRRTRVATCHDMETDSPAPSEALCVDVKKKPSTTAICNGMECGSRRVVVKYEVEMSYDEVLFSPDALSAFELAFTTEVASALQISRTRLEIMAVRRGSIIVYFQILPASRAGERSLNGIVENLQEQLANETSVLRTMGTFARRIEPTGVKLSFSIADDTVAGGDEDISIMGLIGTVMVLCVFVSAFGWFLRRRYHRLIMRAKHSLHQREEVPEERVIGPSSTGMKRMGIKTMA